MSNSHHEAERQRVLAELRVVRLETALVIAQLDLLGVLLKDGHIQPWGARAALADLHGGPTGEGSA